MERFVLKEAEGFKFGLIRDKVAYVNLTTANIIFGDNNFKTTLEVSGIYLDIDIKERESVTDMVDDDFEIGFYIKEINGTNKGNEMLDHIETTLLNLGYESIVIIGNMDLAQAYPGRVELATPYNGYEGVSEDKQIMSLTKFRVF